MFTQIRTKLFWRLMVLFLALSLLAASVGAVGAAPKAPAKGLTPHFSEAVAFDATAPLRDMAAQGTQTARAASPDLVELRPDRGLTAIDQGFSGDGALQAVRRGFFADLFSPTLDAPATMANFEGISNQANFDLFGFRVNPPDPVGDVGPYHYVEMVNLAFAVYDKQGNLLLGPAAIGDLWAGFAIDDCTDPSGDPIVLYDQLEDRWILSQFTTRGFDDPTLPFYDCVAISQTGDPTGAYYRYAFITQPDPDGGYFFPDYPKYGVWTNSYIMTTRDFGLSSGGYGISVYALEKNKMLAGNPNARAVQFFLDSDEVPIYLIGDGLLPPDIDGHRRPIDRIAAPLVGTMDDDFPFYGAPYDALNIWELWVQWRARPLAWLQLADQLPVAAFDSVFPCGPSSRDCLPQPGITNPAQFLDVQSYRQRPIWRLAYRNFGKFESLVTSQSVEARAGVAGMRWYEIRRTDGAYSVYQQGTYAPDDVHRWMGSIAQDWMGNTALGYSVVDGVSVYPGIRFTGRLSGDPLGEMTLSEGVIIDGSGVQTTVNSRWGDYTSMNVDPVDDCTFWYVNEYYEISGFPVNPDAPTTAPWQTRIASFKMPNCYPQDD